MVAEPEDAVKVTTFVPFPRPAVDVMVVVVVPGSTILLIPPAPTVRLAKVLAPVNVVVPEVPSLTMVIAPKDLPPPANVFEVADTSDMVIAEVNPVVVRFVAVPKLRMVPVLVKVIRPVPEIALVFELDDERSPSVGVVLPNAHVP